jgi:hypothetical protein
MFKPNIFLPLNIKRTKQDNSSITSSFQNSAIGLLEWLGIDLKNGDETKFLSEKGTYVSAGDIGWSLTGNAGTDPNVNFIGTTDGVGLKIAATSETPGIAGVEIRGTSTNDANSGIDLIAVASGAVSGITIDGQSENSAGVFISGNNTDTLSADIIFSPVNGLLQILNLQDYADDTAAAIGGIPIDGVYRETATGYLKARIS